MKNLIFIFIITITAPVLFQGCNKATVINDQDTAAKRRENRKKRKGHHGNNNYFGKSHKNKYKQP